MGKDNLRALKLYIFLRSPGTLPAKSANAHRQFRAWAPTAHACKGVA